MSNKIVIHACGGAAISVSSKVIMANLPVGFGYAEVDIHAVDTTDADYKDSNLLNPLWLISGDSHSKGVINGSGGERGENLNDIKAGIPNYLDDKGFKHLKDGEFHIVMSALGGGSGSVIGPIIYKGLAERNIPTIYIGIGDSRDFLHGNHTINTIKTLESFAKKAAKACSFIYLNNTTADKVMNVGEEKVNMEIKNILTGLTIFLSGENQSLDNKDMINLMCMDEYTSIDIQPGIYGLSLVSKVPTPPTGSIPLVARTLTIPNISPDLNIQTFHHKYGYVKSPEIIEIVEKQLPLHLISYGNVFGAITREINEMVSKQKEVISSIVYDGVTGSDSATADDDGMFI